jgi:hypothetical protein
MSTGGIPNISFVKKKPEPLGLYNKENLHVPIRTLKENNGLLHHQVQYPVGVSKKGKWRSMTCECKICN